MGRKSGQFEDEVASLTDAELVVRYRRLASLDHDESLRRREATSRAEAEFLDRPTAETLAAVRAARQEAPAVGPDFRRLGAEMSRRMGAMLKAARLARGLSVREVASATPYLSASRLAEVERGRCWWRADPDLYEWACTDGGPEAVDDRLRLLPSLWTPLLEHPRCRTIRAIAIDPAWSSWNGGAAVDLARSIARSRAFELLPILGDALEEAGCADPEILTHCRAPGVHVLGCWVTDALVGARR